MGGPLTEEQGGQMDRHPTFARAALGELVGTLAMTAMMYVVAPMMGLRVRSSLVR